MCCWMELDPQGRSASIKFVISLLMSKDRWQFALAANFPFVQIKSACQEQPLPIPFFTSFQLDPSIPQGYATIQLAVMQCRDKNSTRMNLLLHVLYCLRPSCLSGNNTTWNWYWDQFSLEHRSIPEILAYANCIDIAILHIPHTIPSPTKSEERLLLKYFRCKQKLGTKSQRKCPASLLSMAVNSSSKQLVNSSEQLQKQVQISVCQHFSGSPWGKA